METICFFLLLILISSASVLVMAQCPSPMDPLHLAVRTYSGISTNTVLIDEDGFPCLRRIGPSLNDDFGKFDSIGCHRDYMIGGYGPWICTPSHLGYIPISKEFGYNVICLPRRNEHVDTTEDNNMSSAAYEHLSCSLAYGVEWNYYWIWSMAIFGLSLIVASVISLHLMSNYGSVTTVALCGLYLLLICSMSVAAVTVAWVKEDLKMQALGWMVAADVVIFFLSTSLVVWLSAHDYHGRTWKYVQSAQHKKYDDVDVDWSDTYGPTDSSKTPNVKGPGLSLIWRLLCGIPMWMSKTLIWFLIILPWRIFKCCLRTFCVSLMWVEVDAPPPPLSKKEILSEIKDIEAQQLTCESQTKYINDQMYVLQTEQADLEDLRNQIRQGCNESELKDLDDMEDRVRREVEAEEEEI